MRIDSREHPAPAHHTPAHSTSVPTPEHDGNRQALPPIRIRVRGLGDGDHPIDFACDARNLDCEPFTSQVRIHGAIIKAGEQIHLKVTASAGGAFECTRCAEPFERVIDAPLTVEFVPPRLVSDPTDPNVHEYDAGASAYLDITEDVRDALALAIPMKHLCRTDCKGLCPECGKDLNQGPCGHQALTETEAKFPALKSLVERLRAEEGNAGPEKRRN